LFLLGVGLLKANGHTVTAKLLSDSIRGRYLDMNLIAEKKKQKRKK